MYDVGASVLAAHEANLQEPSGSGTEGNRIAIGTGQPSGVDVAVGNAIRRLIAQENTRSPAAGQQPRKPPRCAAPAPPGSLDNLGELRCRSLEFGIVQSDWQHHAYRGSSTLTGKPFRNLRSVLDSFDVVGEDLGIERVKTIGAHHLAGCGMSGARLTCVLDSALLLGTLHETGPLERPEESLVPLVKNARRDVYRKGEAIVLQDGTTSVVHVDVKGAASAMVRAGDGTTVPVNAYRPSQVTLFSSLLRGSGAPFDVKEVSDPILITLTVLDVKDLLSRELELPEEIDCGLQAREEAISARSAGLCRSITRSTEPPIASTIFATCFGSTRSGAASGID